MSVAEAQERISSSEFVYWIAREQLGGMHSREERMAGMLAATLANLQRDPRRRSKAFAPGDFFRAIDDAPKTDAQLLAEAMAWATGMNSRDETIRIRRTD